MSKRSPFPADQDGSRSEEAGRFTRGDWWFILLLAVIYMFNFVDRTMVAVAGEKIRHDLELSDLQLGAMGGLAFSLFYAGLGLPLARLAERLSRVRIIVIATALWSVMAMLTGAAGSFAELLLCRMGVGVGEAGFTPALVSMISDRFMPARRSLVFSLIAGGVPLGGAVAAVLGGWITQVYGWRSAFVVVGAPGLLLALLLIVTVPEPRRHDGQSSADTPSFAAVLRRVWQSRAFLQFTFGSGMVGLVGFGLNLFLIPLLVRRFGLPIGQAGLVFALAFSLSTLLGTTLGGILIAPLIRRDVRWYGWAPAAALVISLPFYLGAIYQDDWRRLVALLLVATTCLYAFLPAIMTATQTLVEPRMRASAAALHAFGQTVCGLGFGSVLLGWLSDRLAAAAYAGNYRLACLGGAAAQSDACRTASATGLQHAMLAIGFVLLIAFANYLRAAQSLPGELAERA